MIALWIATGLVSMFGGIGVLVFEAKQWLESGAWQPLAFQGAGFVNDSNTYCWSELACAQ